MRQASFADRHPYWFVAILEAVVVLVYLIAGTASYFLKLSNLALVGLANLGLTLIVIAYLTASKGWRSAGFKAPKQSGDLPYFLLPLVPALLNLIPGVQIESLSQLCGVFAITLLVGFAEEGIFRGLMLQTLKPHGQWRAVISSTLLFGLTHALNALTGKNLMDSMLQIAYALAIGFAYAALALKKEVLWPLVLTHFLTDFAFFLQKPGSSLPAFYQTLLVLSLTLGFSAYGLYVMRQNRLLAALPA